MLRKLLTPRHFLFKFSLHIGVVTICSMGIMLYTISFFINLFGRDPEFNDNIILIHWFIVMIFVLTGFSIYIIGMVAAYKESPRIATITLIGLMIHFVGWIVLTVLSFVNNLTLNNIVCIDNRCADRLFIKNGNWRRADEEHCNNPSILRGVLLGDIDIQEEEGTEGSGSGKQGDEPDPDEIAFVDYVYDHGLGSRTPSNLEKHSNLHARSIQRNLEKNSNLNAQSIQRNNLKTQNDDIDSRKKRNVPFVYNSTVRKRHHYRKMLRRRALKRGFRIKVFNVSERKPVYNTNDSNHRVRTPIGYVGCNAPQHIAFSAICAIMILCLWYVYPIIVFYSYTQRIKRRLSQRGS